MVAPGKVQKLCGCTFVNYGSHHDNYPSVYLTAAAAVGTTSTEVDEFVQRLSKCLTEFKRKVAESAAKKLLKQSEELGGGALDQESGPKLLSEPARE